MNVECRGRPALLTGRQYRRPWVDLRVYHHRCRPTQRLNYAWIGHARLQLFLRCQLRYCARRHTRRHTRRHDRLTQCQTAVVGRHARMDQHIEPMRAQPCHGAPK